MSAVREYSHAWSGRKAIASVLSQIRKAGFTIRHAGTRRIEWGVLRISVDYIPGRSIHDLRLTNPVYTWRGQRRRCDLMLYHDRESCEKYIRDRLGKHLGIYDINPGAPIYENYPGVVHLDGLRHDPKARRMMFYCGFTPEELCGRAERKARRLGWKDWKLFVCDESYGVGGYIANGGFLMFGDEEEANAG